MFEIVLVVKVYSHLSNRYLAASNSTNLKKRQYKDEPYDDDEGAYHSDEEHAGGNNASPKKQSHQFDAGEDSAEEIFKKYVRRKY
jgi:hypothetical protein